MIKSSHILLDTCILSNLSSKEPYLASETEKLLSSLSENNNSFYVSEFTHYELLRSANNKQVKDCEVLLAKFTKKIVNNDNRLKRAIQLYNLYKND